MKSDHKPLIFDRFSWNFYNQWVNPLHSNWFDFTLFNLEFEWDKIMGGLEVSLAILGVYFRARYTYTDTKESDDLKDLVEWFENAEIESFVVLPKNEYAEYMKWKNDNNNN